MKRIRINLDKISDLDLQLARNSRVIALIHDIVKLSLDERVQQLDSLKKKVQEGHASLFEERIQTKLLEQRKAEWIWVIHKNLPEIEQELSKRRQIQASPKNQTMPKTSSPKKSETYMAHDTHSELLKFLETQKPSSSSVSSSPKRVLQNETAKPPSGLHMKDVVVGSLLLLCIVFSVGYVVSSPKDTSAPITTFKDQAQEKSSAMRLSEEFEQEVQTQFDAASQELRLGEFEQGKAQLLALIDTYPTSPYAENAYILLADTYRLRMDNPDEALKYYQTFLEKYPESLQLGLTQLKMGFSYEDMGDIPNAQTTYRLVLSRYGERSRIGQLAGERLQRQEKL